MVPIYQYNKN